MKIFISDLTLQKKIIAVIVLTTLTVTITVMPIIFFTLQTGMQGQQQRHLAGVKHLIEQLIEDNRRTVKNYSVLFSTDRQVKDNLYYFAELAGERIHPLNAIQHLVDAFDLQFVELGDRYGKVVANALRPEQHDQDKLTDVLIRTALSSDVVTGIEKYEHGFLLKAVAPVYHDESQLIGTISTGMIMDDRFVEMIKSLSGVELVIIDQENRVVASTLEAQFQQQMNPNEKKMRHDKKQYQIMNLPFNDSNGQPLGTVIIMAQDNMAVILQKANLNVILVLLVISIVSIAATIFILRRVLSPVDELRKGAEKIGSGEFSHRIAVTSTDEIGSLAEVFNRMASNLQQMREVEERLKHAERLASIGEFTAATAHELNNPIANIIGLLKVVRQEVSDNQAFREDLDVVIKEANRCGAIVRDLLMYSRSSRPHKEGINITHVVEEAISGISDRHTAGKDITIRFDKTERGEVVLADPDQIEQVFRNILLNGIQAITDAGEVVVSVLKDTDDNNVSISFFDNGCGIAKENLDKIFYPFFTTKKSGEGTGLGLAVCFTIIQSHNGNIEVKSTEGKGSTFTVTLPSGEIDGKHY